MHFLWHPNVLVALKAYMNYHHYVPFLRPLVTKYQQYNKHYPKITPLLSYICGKYNHKICSRLLKAFADQLVNKNFKWSCEECTLDWNDHVRKVGGLAITRFEVPYTFRYRTSSRSMLFKPLNATGKTYMAKNLLNYIFLLILWT